MPIVNLYVLLTTSTAIAMALALTNLPQDVLILICLHLLVEDVLALMQTCRVMHALGSLDYLWRRFLFDWDIPLDIPLNVSLASLSSDLLREAAVKSLKMDTRWRDPHLEMRHVQCIITQNSSFVDGMRLLPGGRWLVTLQYEQAARTHVTLWSTEDSSNCHSIFKVTVVGRVRFYHAHHHHALEQITIAFAFARGTIESIRVYNVHLQGESSTRYSLVFEATPNELYPMGRIVGMKINGEIMIAVFAPLPSLLDHEGQIVCVNLASKVTAVLECPDWSFAWGRLKIFCRHFAVTTTRYTPQHTTAWITFYELPSTIFDHPDRLSPPAPCWPEKVAVKSSLIASTSWTSQYPLVFELSDDLPTSSTKACSFTIFGYPVRTQRRNVESLGIDILDVSFGGKDIECTLTVVPCCSTPSPGEVRVSPSGKRAVWLNQDPDTHECALIKFALGRIGNESGPYISTLMPSFSGLPLNPRDFHSFVFDEISCKMAVSLQSGELYILYQ